MVVRILSRPREGVIRVLNAATAINPLAQSWAAAVVANGGTVSRKRLLDTSWLITQLQNHGIWDLTQDFFPICPEGGNAPQGLTSLKTRTLGTANGTMAFVDGCCVFNGGYIDTTVIPAAPVTGTNMRSMVWETTNALVGFADGLQDSTNKNLAFRPRASSRLTASLNSSSTSSSVTITDASGFSGASRNSSAANAPITFWKDGVTLGTTVAPTTTTNVIPSVRSFYIGGFNNAGSLSTPIAGRLRWADMGAELTAQQQADYYAILSVFFVRIAPGASIYVSNVNYGGIPIGNDSTGLGTAAAPYLTYDVGLVSTPDGGIEIFNGDTASPATYNTNATVTKGVTFKPVNALGAILAGTGTSRIFLVSPALGQPVTYQDVIIDGAANTGGPAQRGIQLSSMAAAYSFNLIRCLLRGWDSLEGVTPPSASAQIFAAFTDSEFTSTNARSAIAMRTMTGGGVIVDGCEVDITGNTTGHGAIYIAATAAGVYGRIVDTDCTMTVHASATGTGRIYATRIENIANGLIDGGAHEVIGTGLSDGTKRGYGLGIGTNEAGDATELSIDGGIVRNATVYCTTYGGIAAYIGGDNNDPTKATNLLMQDVTISGDAQFVAGGGHGAFMANTTNSILRRVAVSSTALGLIDKGSTGGTIEDCSSTGATTSEILLESSTNAIVRRNTVTMTSASNPYGIHLYQNVSPLGPVTSGAVISDNDFICNGATGATFVLGDAGCSGAFSNNTYTLTSGTLASPPFVYNGVGLTKAQWLAQVEPTAIFIGF